MSFSASFMAGIMDGEGWVVESAGKLNRRGSQTIKWRTKRERQTDRQRQCERDSVRERQWEWESICWGLDRLDSGGWWWGATLLRSVAPSHSRLSVTIPPSCFCVAEFCQWRSLLCNYLSCFFMSHSSGLFATCARLRLHSSGVTSASAFLLHCGWLKRFNCRKCGVFQSRVLPVSN